MIPDIEEIRREAQLLPLRDAEILDQRKIPVLLERPAINIAAQIPERRGASIRIQRTSGRIGRRREGKVRAIQISVVHARYDAPGGIARRDCAAGYKLRAGSRRFQSAANVGSAGRAIQHGKWRTGLKNSDAAHRPPTQGCMPESAGVFEKRKLVAVTNHETVWPIKIRQPS